MQVTHYICPRGCGKTEKAKEIQMEDPENTLLFLFDSGSFGKSMRGGRRYKTIIYDEFLNTYSKQNTATKKDRFLLWIMNDLMSILEPDGHLILFSTPDKLRSSSSFLLMQKGLINRSQIESKYVNEDTIMEEIIEFQKLYMCPFGTNVTLIKTDLGKPKSEEQIINYQRMYELSDDKCRVDMKGDFLR